VNRVWTIAAPAQCGPSQRLNKQTQLTAASKHQSCWRIAAMCICSGTAVAVAAAAVVQLWKWQSCLAIARHKPLCRG
jgi:hypothetical protein